MGNVTSEQKLKLAQMIRAESQDNRQRMRSRERILYGTGGKTAPEDLPLYSKDGYDFFDKKGKELYALEEGTAETTEDITSFFKLRLILAVILFAGFLIIDASGMTIAGISPAWLIEEMNKDFDTGIPALSFDFENNFPYTLFGR